MTIRGDAQVLRRMCWLGVAAMITACSDGPGPAFGACPQTGEFANFGCARVEGVVRDEAGNPLADARVVLFLPEDSPYANSIDSPTHETDSTGAYSLEIHDYGFPGRDAPPPDPVPMNLRAFLLPESTVDPIFSSDFIPVTLQFAAVGELPEVTEMDITIDVSP